MPHAYANGVEIYYEAQGPEDGEPMLFIEGSRVQMVGWRPGFIAKFLDRGLRVIRFDNRDVGLSQKFGGPEDLDGGYSISDMAGDSFAVLDAVGVERAHIVGQSMGGMIAQVMASTRPERVKSLALLYTAPSLDHEILGRTPTVLAVQERLPRDQAIERDVEMERVSQSTEFAFDTAWVRELATLSYDRCYAPDGVVRQVSAILRSVGQPFADPEKITMPTTIIHGRADALVSAKAALELARLLPQSEVHIFQGLGHEIAQPLWGDMAAAICRGVDRGRRVDAAA